MKFCENLNAMFEDDVDGEEEAPTSVTPVDEQEEQALDLMAHAIAAGIAEIEEQTPGMRFTSTDEAVSAAVRMITVLRQEKRDVLRKALRRYERIGREKFRKEYKRKLDKSYDTGDEQ